MLKSAFVLAFIGVVSGEAECVGEACGGSEDTDALKVSMLQKRGNATDALVKRKAEVLNELEQIEALQDDPDEPDDEKGATGYHHSPNTCCSRRRRKGECAARRRRWDFGLEGHGDKECGHCDSAGCGLQNSKCPSPQKCVGEPNPYNRPPTCQCNAGPPPCAAQGNYCGYDGDVHNECCRPYGDYPEGTVSRCDFAVGNSGKMTCQYKTEGGCKGPGDTCGKFGTQMGHCCNGLQCKDADGGKMTCMSGAAAR